MYANAYSQAGWTLPSVATILTGHYPRDHGATDFHWSLDVSLRPLASILRRAGYDTQGYVSHVMLTPTYGIGDGFANFDYSVLNIGHPHDVATAGAMLHDDGAVPATGLGPRRAEMERFLWTCLGGAVGTGAR